MDLGSAIIGIIVLGVFTLPFIITNRSRNKIKKQYLKSLLNIAEHNNCQIDQHEIFGSFAIGLDETKKFVFFYRQTKNNVKEQSINLGLIQNCRVVNISRATNSKNRNEQVIDRLELNFLPMEHNQSEIKLEFYNADENAQLYGELQSIEKWSIKIQDLLRNMK